MSVTIEEITALAGDTERRLVLSNSQWAAKLNAGATWNTLRIGIRGWITNWGASLIATPRLYMGVCSDPNAGFANGPLSGANCKHFVGMRTDTSTAADTFGNQYDFSTNNAGCVQVGATVNKANIGSNSLPFSYTALDNRLVCILEMVKGSPWTAELVLHAYSGTISDLSKDNFINAMEVETMTDVKNYLSAVSTSYVTTGPRNMPAVDEGTNGDLNSICIAWNRSIPSFHFSDFFFAIRG